MAKKTPEKPHTPSAYDEFLRSGEFDTIESDIDYFSAKPKQPQPKRAAQAQPRSAGVRTSSKKTIKRAAVPTQTVRKAKPAGKSKRSRKKTASSGSKLSQEYLAMKAEQEQRSGKAPAKKRSVQYPEKKAQQSHARQQKQYKNDNLTTLITAAILTALLFGFSIITLTSRIKPYSEDENRYLAGRPKLSAASVADGKYMDDMENYLSDQFAGRSALVKARTALDIMCGKKEINNVYIGKDHFLFEKPTAYDEATVAPTIEAINNFTNKYKKLNSFMALAPTASSVLSDFMPANAPVIDRQKQIKTVYSQLHKSIHAVDVYSTLAGNDDRKSLYYRTDHHWTTRAAELAFKQIAANMKLDTSKTAIESLPVSNTFQGTLASSSGLFNAKDTIEIAVPKTDVKYVVTNLSEKKKSSSVFVSDKLKQKNQYEVFFGGNFSQINIDTTLNSKRVLMVVKDSYANCLIPMLVPYYKRIVIIDPRYYTDDINKTIKNEGVTDILWLYNADTFLADTSIQTVFR
ncbi:MAG: hypothetical protein E7517_07320 [Ruminococcaceae bacterium]|nr:hypothetical protein [Oscillospiraceae bacterium]